MTSFVRKLIVIVYLYYYYCNYIGKKNTIILIINPILHIKYREKKKAFRYYLLVYKILI